MSTASAEGIQTVPSAEIRKLAAFRSESAPVVSCYLDVDGRRHPRQAEVEANLERMLRSARASAPGQAASAFDRIRRHVSEGVDRTRTRGLAMFACAQPELWRVFSLPVPVRSRVVVNSSPAVGQLEAVVQELARVGVLLVDRQRARAFVFEMGEIIDRSERIDEVPRHYDSIGERDLVGRDKAVGHVDELVAQHVRHATSAAFELFREDGFDRLLIGAPSELLGTVEASLHPYLRERLAGRVEVPVSASPEEVRQAVMAAEARLEREAEAERVRMLRDAIGSGGRGVAGLEATLAALVERRVDVLCVSHGYRETGWRCPQCGHLAHVGPTCPVDGVGMQHVEDIVEEAVDAAIAQSCHVEICVDNADLDVLGRIGAILRF